MVRTICAFFASLLFATTSFASPVSLPDIPKGSFWVFKVKDLDTNQLLTVFNLSVVNKDNDGYDMLRTDVLGQSQRFRLTRQLGQGSAVLGGAVGDGNLYDFPLKKGKRWSTVSNWVNDDGQKGFDRVQYAVVGEQMLAVEAGTFRVVKVVGVGRWKNTTLDVGGTLHVTLYYSPEARMTIRSERITGSSEPGQKATKNSFESMYYKLGPK